MTKAYEDIIYTAEAGVATIAVNRPDRLNAYREETYYEVLDALQRASWDKDIGVIVMTGVGGKAFGVGGDSGVKKSERSGRGMLGVPIEDIHTAIRDAPKPVIAKVVGSAIGGDNVMATN